MRPGRIWRWTRVMVQGLALFAIFVAPFLGGWQRLDRAEMSFWAHDGYDLPASVLDSLPDGDKARAAYDGILLAGGGTAVDYFGIPAADPVASAAVLLRGTPSTRFLVAALLPLLLAGLVGRFFCGWLCPFGVLARLGNSLRRHLPGNPRPLRIPSRRPLRWAILFGSIGLSAVGLQVAALFFLPHLLVQQSVYGMWLLSGGGAALAILLGLMVAGMVFGPSAYCAAICPTGAVLSAAAWRKPVRITLVAPTACGKNCRLCSNECWLQLEPAGGEPGPDCDLCARCFEVCPKDNLAVVTGPPKRRLLPVIAGLVFGISSLAGGSRTARAESAKPHLVLHGERVVDGVVVAVEVVDMEGVQLVGDGQTRESGLEVSVYVARGDEVYAGPLSLEIDCNGAHSRIDFAVPNAPVSTPNRSIYRRRLPHAMAAGDGVRVLPVAGWLPFGQSYRVPEVGTRRPVSTLLYYALGATLLFGGLLAVALSVGEGPPRPKGTGW